LTTRWIMQTNLGLIESEVYAIADEVVKQGHIFNGVPYTPGTDIKLDVDDDECVICYGGIDFVRQIQRYTRFIPGVWCNFTNMKCSTYYAYFGDMLLNRNYVMMPIVELERRWNSVCFGRMFVRPDSGAKPFVGQIIGPKELHKIQSLSQAVGPETLVVISKEKKISEEYRLVVCDRKIVAASRYFPEELRIDVFDLPRPLFCLASSVCEIGWQPDLCYTLDIAIHDGRPYVLEVNSFSCSGFYECDISSIVSHASSVALMEYESYKP